MFGGAEFQQLYALLSGDMSDVDCGERCGKYCCGHGYMAKYLLPGEREFLEAHGVADTVIFIESQYITGYRGRHDPSCACGTIRDVRPFCCRMFPFRPTIEGTRVTGLHKATGDRLAPCWYDKPLSPWEKAAIEAWNFIFADRTNLEFYAKLALLFEIANADEPAQDRSPLALLNALGDREPEALWAECARFFGRTT